MGNNPKELRFRVKRKMDGYYYPQHKAPKQIFWSYFWNKLNFITGVEYKFHTHSEANTWLLKTKTKLGV